MEEKTCIRCLEIKPTSEFWKMGQRKDGLSPYCKVCDGVRKRESDRLVRERIGEEAWAERRRGYVTTYRKLHPDRVKEQDRRQKLRKKYGITPEDYERRLEKQKGGCAICLGPSNRANGGFEVDHDHLTNDIRGLLCQNCNFLLGHARDEVWILDAAIGYLKRRGVHGETS